jgi:CelD/BcsL family acetyltransferase involved in cellulose biosynthesis
LTVDRPANGSSANRVSTVEARITTEVVTSVEGMRALQPDYEQLYPLSPNLLPFARQEWHLAWCAHFLKRSALVNQHPLFCVMRGAAGECVAIFPLLRTVRHIGTFRFVTLSLIGPDRGLTEMRDPLIRPGCERPAVRALHEVLRQYPDWDWIQWSGISTLLAQAVSYESAAQWHEPRDDYLLDLPGSWQEFRAGLRRNIRESLRHCYNSLRRDGHEFEFVVARERSDVRAALTRFLELHARRAEMSWGTPHPNRFDSAAKQAFLYDVCDRLAQRDAVRVFQLRIAGQIVASRLAFVIGDSLYLYYSGFDPAWARYSVMTTTVAEAIKYAIGAGLRTLNLSPTAEQSKLRWRPRLVEFPCLIVRRELLSSRLKYQAYRVTRTAALSAMGSRLREMLRTHPPH